MAKTRRARTIAFLMCAGLLMVAPPLAAEESPGASVAPLRAESHSGRPIVLVPLYVAFAGLQALDMHSTMTALDAGGTEVNPVVRGALGSPAKMMLLKGGTAAAVVFLSERMWKKNRTAAIVTMIALNSAYATIAAHNYQTVRR
jgi:hypothetical protein